MIRVLNIDYEELIKHVNNNEYLYNNYIFEIVIRPKFIKINLIESNNHTVIADAQIVSIHKYSLCTVKTHPEFNAYFDLFYYFVMNNMIR